MDAEGLHARVNATGADPALLADAGMLREILVDGLDRSGATVRKVIVDRFEPVGVTILVSLGESGAMLHTYPEVGVWYLDVFTCGDIDPNCAATFVRQAIGGRSEVKVDVREPPA